MKNLSIERLEGRDVPSVTLVNGTLNVLGGAGDDAYQFDLVNGQVRVVENGVTSLFPSAAVTNVVADTGAGNDDFANNTAVPGVVNLGLGDDTYIDGGGNDTVVGGPGKDVIYALLGNNSIFAQDGEFDRVFVGAASTVARDAGDQFVNFFAQGRGPGAGNVSLEQGVLYITPDNNGSVASVTQVGNATVVTLDGVTTTFTGAVRFPGKSAERFSPVTAVAYFGGGGDDVFVNYTSIDTVAYGGLGGNDTLVGGYGNYNLLKGGGGNDTVVGRGVYNDLAGNAGADVLILLGKGVVRRDAADIFP